MRVRTRDPKAGCNAMAADSGGEPDKARRFRDAALPHLDDLYTLARYLLRSSADAEDAVQECCLRAFRHFDGLRGPRVRPWLLAILRNVCRAEFARRSGAAETDLPEDAVPLWSEAQDTPEAAVLRQWDVETIRRLVAALPDQFREAIVLREIHDLSYHDIAEIVEAPVGTVMSRLARARAMLRASWLKEEGKEQSQ